MEDQKRRRQKRIPNRIPVRFGTDEPTFSGFTRNISLSGLEILSRTVFYPNTVLHMEIDDHNQTIHAKGVVRWITNKEQFLNANLKQYMGIQLIERPENYLRMLVDRIDQMQEKRREPRFGKVFKVIFESPQNLMEEYSQDISCGGLFVLTEIPPPIGTFVSLQIVLPDTLQIINAEGVVVHSIDRKAADSMGLNPGIGVQFNQFLDDGKLVLDQYVERMRKKAEEE